MKMKGMNRLQMLAAKKAKENKLKSEQEGVTVSNGGVDLKQFQVMDCDLSE